MKKGKKITWVFVFQKYGKFWSISLEHFIKHKPLISEEWYYSITEKNQTPVFTKIIYVRKNIYLTERVKSPGLVLDGLARKLPSTPRFKRTCCASIPLIFGWNHLKSVKTMVKKIFSVGFFSINYSVLKHWML